MCEEQTACTLDYTQQSRVTYGHIEVWKTFGFDQCQSIFLWCARNNPATHHISRAECVFSCVVREEQPIDTQHHAQQSWVTYRSLEDF